jgi:lipopolysaccharide biosynthesis regulator YciM
MDTQLPLLTALVALLVGLAIGKAWERYKLRDGRWIDRRKARESPHFILGLNFLVSNQLDAAIDELTRAVTLAPEALEIHMILGNLYREKGLVGRAIATHQDLLQRPKLTKLERAYVFLCLGLDYKSAGFIDRASAAFTEVLRFDSGNRYALVNLEKLHEDQHQWQEAYDIRKRLVKNSEPAEVPRNQAILAFLEHALGQQAFRQGDRAAAAARFRSAIDLDARAVPAYLNLGDLRVEEGQPAAGAEVWEQVLQVAPERAYLTFDRLAAVYPRLGSPNRFPELCRQLISKNPQDWRARLALARHLAAQGERSEAFELLLEALPHNPHSLSIHQAIWQTITDLGLDLSLVQRYTALTKVSVFYLDPHICLRCRYRSTELLWQCPHCHEWNTFVEERIAPAKDTNESGV